MRAIIQRVQKASVDVEGEQVASINKGILVLVGFLGEDNEKTYEYMLDKMIHLRIFEDDNEKMNLSVKDVEGDILIVPNFTLYGDCRKGRRPSYAGAASPSDAKGIFDAFVSCAKEKYQRVWQGVFQADMKVSLLNDGPVTLLLDSEKNF